MNNFNHDLVEGEEFKQWCMYCKEEIEIGEPFVTCYDNVYHIECYKQLSTFPDVDWELYDEEDLD